jgi:hypothetical protein
MAADLHFRCFFAGNYREAESPAGSGDLKVRRREPKGRSVSGPRWVLGFVVDRPVFVRDAAVETTRPWRRGVPAADLRRGKAGLDEGGRWLMRIPPFRNAIVSINKDGDCSGIANLPH